MRDLQKLTTLLEYLDLSKFSCMKFFAYETIPVVKFSFMCIILTSIICMYLRMTVCICITVYHETFVAGSFHGFRCFSYRRESFMPNNLHHRHNP